MSDYTIKNLREVEDSAPGFGMTEIGEARFAQGDLDSQTIGFSLQRPLDGDRGGGESQAVCNNVH